MENVHTNPQLFNYQPAAPLPHKLDDYRVVRGSYGGSFSGKSGRPAWLAAIMIFAVAGTAIGVSVYSDHNAMLTSSPALAPTHSTPLGPTVPATSERAIAPVAPVAKQSSAIDPASVPTKVETPKVLPAATPASEPMSPAKTKPRAATKSEPVVSKRIAPDPASPVNQVVTPPQEVAPIAPPPPVIQEPPVVPQPLPTPSTTPIVPPLDPPKMN